ncbi:MAG: fimbria/pilus outer membrane usher protein [Smithellaceae bacterium]
MNKEIKGDFFAERDVNGNIYLKTEDVVALMLQFRETAVILINGEKYISLNDCLDVSYTFDEKNLAVAIVGKTTESKRTTIEMYSLGKRNTNLYSPREPSAFLNYGVTYSYFDPFGTKAYSVSNRIGGRAGDFFFVSDSLFTKNDTTEQLVRLQSNITYESRGNMQWFVLGDQYANSGNLGSTVNIGGIGFSKLYRLDPYFITQPVFNFQGVTQFPTEADIYLDGILVKKQSIAPGQFDLANIYSYAGSHKLDIVLKDPFGREQRISYPLYFSTQLLRQGLHEYSYNLGFLREGYGTDSNNYSKPAFSAFHRYGITSAFNIGARAEGTDSAYNGGISTAFSLPHIGVITLSAAASNAENSWGTAASVQHSYQHGNFNTNLQLQGYSRDYATVSSPASETITKYAANLGVGFQLGSWGGVSAGYTESQTHSNVTTRTVSGSYSRQLTQTIGLFATASTSFADNSTSSFYVGLNYTPGNNIRGSATLNKSGDTNTETLQIQKDTPVGEGLGYHLYTNRTETSSAISYGINPGFQYNGHYGIYTVDAAILNTNQGQSTGTYNFSAAGSLLYAGGFFAASRPVNDSFSIVMVDKLADATIFNNGQAIGTTNSSGTMVVPNLVSYGQNQITLDVKNMPLNYSISGVSKAISPPAWSGSCISFDALKIHAVSGIVYFLAGSEKVPLEYIELSMKVGEKNVTFPTGKGGAFYLENALRADSTSGGNDNLSCAAIAERREKGGDYIKPGSYTIWGEANGKKCTFSIAFPTTDDIITDLGELQCLIP